MVVPTQPHGGLNPLCTVNEVKTLSSTPTRPSTVPKHDIINVTGMDDLDDAMRRLQLAQAEFATFTQAKIDAIVEFACDYYMRSSVFLAQLAHDETGMGRPDHKHLKNSYAVDYVRKWYRGTKTCGVVSTDEENGVDVIATPMGVIAAIVPTTNPTSTVGFKALCCLKTRNAIIVAPHPRAKACSYEALRIIIEGAVAAGAPADIAACCSNPSVELSGALMKHEKTSLVLATGGPGMVKAAHSSGNPAIGVGPGNVPVIVDSYANLHEVAENVIRSKNYDNGLICSSEQVVLVEDSVYEILKEEFLLQGAYFLNDDEKVKVGQLLFKDGGMINANIVGQSPIKIATMAGVEVPETTTLLVGEFETMDSPFAREKLSPVLGFTKRSDIDQLFSAAVEVLKLGGEGHTACYYTNQNTQNSRIKRFADNVTVTRCLINQPTTAGGTGAIYNFSVPPSMTKGCGTDGGNYVSDNVGPKHLLNYKRISVVADDHTIVMKNIDCLVPQHRAIRCAMEILILAMVLVAKDQAIIEPFPELVSIVDECKKFLEGTGGLERLREAILYFTQHGLYSTGHIELNLLQIAKEFNIPGGNLFPILFPDVAHKLEEVDWSNLKVLKIGVEDVDSAIELVKKLQKGANMPMKILRSTRHRVEGSGVADIANTLTL